MHVARAQYQGNPNIGLFCYANDSYCLVPALFPEQLKKQFKEIFQVPIHEMKAAGTNLLGVFFSGNEDMLFVPKIMFDAELQQLGKYDIPFTVIDSRLTALGNNLLINGSICIASSKYEEEALKTIKKFFAVKKGKIAELDIVGSLAKGNKKGILVSSAAKDFEVDFIEDTFKIKAMQGTVNFGSSYISSGVVCNSHGFVIGQSSGGPEIQNADEALGFVE